MAPLRRTSVSQAARAIGGRFGPATRSWQWSIPRKTVTMARRKLLGAVRRPSSASELCLCLMCRSALFRAAVRRTAGYARRWSAIPRSGLKVISVTGTHGKTTVARLLDAIFRHAGAAVGTLDSFGYWDGWEDESAVGRLTPPAVARSLAQMAAAGASHAVLEVSSRELCEQVLAGVTLDAACVTNVCRKRLDWHGSVENYRQAERRVLDHLHPDGVAIFNADDPVSMRMLCDVNQPALTFGLQKPAEITAEIIEQHVNEQVFLLSAGEESVCVRTAIVGDHHVYNCLAAATTALAYGVELTTIARGLESVDLFARTHGTRGLRARFRRIDRCCKLLRVVACLPARGTSRHKWSPCLCVWSRCRQRCERVAGDGPRCWRDRRLGRRDQQWTGYMGERAQLAVGARICRPSKGTHYQESRGGGGVGTCRGASQATR